MFIQLLNQPNSCTFYKIHLKNGSAQKMRLLGLRREAGKIVIRELPRDVTSVLFLMQSNIQKRAGKSWPTESEAIFTFTLPTIEYADTQEKLRAKISSSISDQTQNQKLKTNTTLIAQ